MKRINVILDIIAFFYVTSFLFSFAFYSSSSDLLEQSVKHESEYNSVHDYSDKIR